MDSKRKIIIFAIIGIIIIGILSNIAFYFYRQSKVEILDENHFFIEIEDETNKEKIAFNWMSGFLEQYMQNYVPSNIKIKGYEIKEIKSLDNNYVQIDFNIKTLSKKSRKIVEKFSGAMDQYGNIECQLVIKLEIVNNSILSKKICFVTQMIRPAAYDLEYYNKSGQAEYDKNYYQFMDKKKYEDMKKECTYKIEDKKLYFTYDYSNSWKEIPEKITKYVISDNEYKLNDQLYYISKNLTYIASDKAIYVSDNEGNDFKEIKFSNTGDIVYVYMESINDIFIVVAADYAMGSYMPIIYNSKDLGNTWQIRATYEQIGGLRSAIFTALDSNSMYIINTNASGDSSTILFSSDGMKNFNIVNLPEGKFSTSLEGDTLKWKDIYDTPEKIVKEGNKYRIIVGQGSDGDYMGNRTKALYESDDNGKTWYFVEEFEQESEPWEG